MSEECELLQGACVTVTDITFSSVLECNKYNELS